MRVFEAPTKPSNWSKIECNQLFKQVNTASLNKWSSAVFHNFPHIKVLPPTYGNIFVIAFIQKRKLWIGSSLPSWCLFKSPLHIQKRIFLHFWKKTLTQRKGILTLFLFSYFGMIHFLRITHFWPIWTSFKVDSLDANRYCIENLPHIGRQGSHLTIRYYHQDLHWCMIQTRSLSVSLLSLRPLLQGIYNASHQLTKGRPNISLSLCRLYVGTLLAPLIFKAVAFVRRVFTHSLADSNFHGHSPNVFIQQHFLWFLIMSVHLRHI